MADQIVVDQQHDSGVPIHNTVNGIKVLPKIGNAAIATVPNFSSPLSVGHDLPKLNINESDVANSVWQASSGIDRRFTVFGSKDGSIKEETLIGRVAVPCKAKFTCVRGAARPQRCFTLTPAVAAMASELKDRSYVAAITAAQTLFNTGSSTERFSNVAQSAVRYLLGCPPDPTRFIFKMAQMWAYHAYCEKECVNAALVGSMVQPTAVNSVSTISSALSAAKNNTHYCFVAGEQFGGNFTNFLSVLSAAASNLLPANSQRETLPSILSMEIDMPQIVVAYTSDTDEAQSLTIGLTAADVWEAMGLWCALHSCTNIMDECVNFVLSQMFSTKRNGDEIFGVGSLNISLPSLDMRHYALFPLHMAVSNLPELDILEPPNILTTCAMLVARNQMLSVIFSSMLSRLHVGASHNNRRHIAGANRWLSRVFSHRGGHPIPVWHCFDSAIKDLKMPCSFSLMTAGMSPAPWNSSNLQECWKQPLMLATQFEELVDILEELPACNIAHMLAPAKSTKLLQPGAFYGMDQLNSSWFVRAAYAIYGCGGAIYNIERLKGRFNSEITPVNIMVSYRNVLHDNAIPTKFVDNDYEQLTAFTIPDAAASVKLHSGDTIRAGWLWYISGVSAGEIDIIDAFRLGPALEHEKPVVLAGSASGNTPPYISAPAPVEAQVEKEIAFVPEPTELELLEAVKKRVPKQVSMLVESIQQNTADGMIKDLANTLLKCSDPVLPSGYTRMDYCRTYFGNLKEQMSGISVADAVRPCLMPRRHSTAKGIASMLRQLLKYTDYEDNRKILAEFAVRADNLAAAMATNPALLAAELSQTMNVPETIAETLNGISTAAAEYGISLDSFVSVKVGRWETKTVDEGSVEHTRLLKERWVQDRNQGKVQIGKIRLGHRVESYTRPLDIEMLFDERLAEKQASSVQRLLDMSAADAADAESQAPMTPPAAILAKGLSADETDETIGREGAPPVSATTSVAIEEVRQALGDADFRASPTSSGHERSPPTTAPSGIGSSTAGAGAANLSVLQPSASSGSTSEPQQSESVVIITPAEFEDVDSQ